MPRRGKKYKSVAVNIVRLNIYNFSDAIKLVLDCHVAKFDETVDIAVKLSVDPRHADQMVRGTVALPHGVGKTVWVLVFAKGEKEKEALDAGADYAGSDEFVGRYRADGLILIRLLLLLI
jgi:large subunit ribosomal protein L1